MSTREYGSGCERCASHGKSVHAFYKGLSNDEILEKFPPTTRKWVQEIIDASASASSGAPSSAVVANLQSQIVALSAQFGSSRIASSTAAASDFVVNDGSYCDTVAALTSGAAPPRAQSFDVSMVESVAAFTGCSRNETFTSLMQCGGQAPGLVTRTCAPSRTREPCRRHIAPATRRPRSASSR